MITLNDALKTGDKIEVSTGSVIKNVANTADAMTAVTYELKADGTFVVTP